MAAINMSAPNTGQFVAASGVVYTPNASGVIFNVALLDVPSLLNEGCQIIGNAANAGAPGANVTAAEFGYGYDHTTILTFGAGAVLPAIAGGASLGVGVLVYTFPAGAQQIIGSAMNVGITQSAGNINANTPTVGLGHVVASGAISVLSGTATFQSINVGKAAANCTGTPTEQAVNPTASPFTLITDVGGVKAVFFNAAAAWSAGGDPAAKLSGSITLAWKTLQ